MNTKEVINNNKAINTKKQKHLQIDGVTALFKNGEELGVVSGFDVVSGCWFWFDIVFVTVSMWAWVSRCKVSGRWTRLEWPELL